MTDDAAERGVDPGNIPLAIERYRDLAKYLVGIFAAVGGLLVAGTQLSSLGQLSWDDDRARLMTAVIALALALVAVILVLGRAVSILRPLELALADVADESGPRTAIEARPTLLGGARDVKTVAALVDPNNEAVDAAARARWSAVAAGIVEYAAYREMQRRFDVARMAMLAYAVLAAAAIALFAWAANPPDDPADAVVAPAAAQVQVALTDAGREAFAGALGARCVKRPLAALVVGGTRREPLLVALPRAGCAPAQFTLPPVLGALLGRSPAG